MGDNPGPALAELITRLSSVARSDRPGLLRQLLPLLADERLPVSARISAAASALKLFPDRHRPVRRIARVLTSGLSPSRALVRLRHLQHHLESSPALDSLIDAREKRVKLVCPRCRVRLPRIEMVKHLWHEHGLLLERGKTRPINRVIEELQERHATTGETEPLDRVAELAGAAGLRKWLAGEDLPAEDLAPLLSAAADAGCGLCPACFAQVPAAVSPMPEPLTFAHGRLAGDGYAIEVGGGAWFRTLRVSTPDKATPAGRLTLAPRAISTLVATGGLIIALFFLNSISSVVIAILAAMLIYVAMRLYLSSNRSSADRAVDAAWRRLAPSLTERAAVARFLTRLCLASTGRGNPEFRARSLSALVTRAAGRAEESDAELQLLAAAKVLHVEDGARYGRDEVAGIAGLAAEALTGALPADFAEFAVGAYLARVREVGDLARLRILIAGAAFEAGFGPRDLIEMCAGAPNLRRAIAFEPGHRLGLAFGVWQMRQSRPWGSSIAPAETVFELARTSPPTSARLLATYPDLLLHHRPESAVADLLGPILICARGVAVAGYMTSDADAEVRVAAKGRELIFGRHRIEVSRPLPAELATTLTGWLEFRARSLLPFIDINQSPRSIEPAQRLLGPFSRKCLQCGTVAAIARGMIGRTVLQ